MASLDTTALTPALELLQRSRSFSECNEAPKDIHDGTTCCAPKQLTAAESINISYTTQLVNLVSNSLWLRLQGILHYVTDIKFLAPGHAGARVMEG